MWSILNRPTPSRSPTPSHARNRRPQVRRGLSLVEGMMSVFVASVALVLAIQSYYSLGQWQRNLERRELANQEAANVMEREFHRPAARPASATPQADDKQANNSKSVTKPSDIDASATLASALAGARVRVERTPGDPTLKEIRIDVSIIAPGPEGGDMVWAKLTAWQYEQETAP